MPFEDKWCEYTEFDEMSEESEFTYINLNDNKERYTAYNGTIVWLAIYKENCLPHMMKNIKHFDPNSNKICHEETLLF